MISLVSQIIQYNKWDAIVKHAKQTQLRQVKK